MSAFPLALPTIGTTLIPPEDPAMLTNVNTATLTPGIGSANEGTSLTSMQDAIEQNLFPNLSAASKLFGAVTGTTSGNSSGLASWFGARSVVLILGLMLIAAGLFSLNPVKEKIILAGKTAAKAAAAA